MKSMQKIKKDISPFHAGILNLDALVEILDNKRFITCHSYVQSEINSAMEVANRMGISTILLRISWKDIKWLIK